MEAIANNPKFAKKVGIKPSVGKDFEAADKGKKFAKGGPVLSVGRGEKMATDKGAGLTAKGRAKYNAATGSHLKAPAPHPKSEKEASRKKSFCSRMKPIAEKSERGSRARASMRRWNCSD